MRLFVILTIILIILYSCGVNLNGPSVPYSPPPTATITPGIPATPTVTVTITPLP